MPKIGERDAEAIASWARLISGQGRSIEFKVNRAIRPGTFGLFAHGCLGNALPLRDEGGLIVAHDQETLDAAFEIVARALDAPEVGG